MLIGHCGGQKPEGLDEAGPPRAAGEPTPEDQPRVTVLTTNRVVGAFFLQNNFCLFIFK